MQNLYLTDSHPLFPLAFHLILASPATSVRAKGNRFRYSSRSRPHYIMESVGMREKSKYYHVIYTENQLVIFYIITLTMYYGLEKRKNSILHTQVRVNTYEFFSVGPEFVQ